MFRWAEPRAYPALYYQAWYYFPQQYSVAQWWNVMQWKSQRDNTSTNDPFFVLNVGNRPDGSLYCYLYDWQTKRSYHQTVKNIPIGQWLQIQAFYSCAGDGTGRITIWQDGVLLFDIPNVQTRYSDGDCQWSVNNYSDAIKPQPVTIYVDDAAITLQAP
jgi:hypothetical protein